MPSYKHILVAVDLSKTSIILIEKAILIARPYNTKISIIHVSLNYSNLYTGLMNIDFSKIQKLIFNDSINSLKKLTKNCHYKFSKILSSQGELNKTLNTTIKNYNIDLLICGHHQDFLSKFISSARQLIEKIKIDVLIIPLKNFY